MQQNLPNAIFFFCKFSLNSISIKSISLDYENGLMIRPTTTYNYCSKWFKGTTIKLTLQEWQTAGQSNHLICITKSTLLKVIFFIFYFFFLFYSPQFLAPSFIFIFMCGYLSKMIHYCSLFFFFFKELSLMQTANHQQQVLLEGHL